MHDLAIIVPAYKKKYLSETLDSIASQSNKNFVIYIGDDNSKEDLYEIVKKYESKVNIVYKKFDANMGSYNLVGHWKRCVDMVCDERWIMMFSDDDIMEKDCVKKFYEAKEENPKAKAFKYRCDIINENGVVIKKDRYENGCMKCEEYFLKRIKSRINSFIVEYVFRRDVYNDIGGFEEYPMAWCSDDAFWIKVMSVTSIQYIKETRILWRYSGYNISSISADGLVAEKKVHASISYLMWVKKYFQEKGIRDKTTEYDKYIWFCSQLYMAGVESGERAAREYILLYSMKCCGDDNIIRWAHEIYWLYCKSKRVGIVAVLGRIKRFVYKII